jgi:hypothetical protein
MKIRWDFSHLRESPDIRHPQAISQGPCRNTIARAYPWQRLNLDFFAHYLSSLSDEHIHPVCALEFLFPERSRQIITSPPPTIKNTPGINRSNGVSEKMQVSIRPAERTDYNTKAHFALDRNPGLGLPQYIVTIRGCRMTKTENYT